MKETYIMFMDGNVPLAEVSFCKKHLPKGIVTGMYREDIGELVKRLPEELQTDFRYYKRSLDPESGKDLYILVEDYETCNKILGIDESKCYVCNYDPQNL